AHPPAVGVQRPRRAPHRGLCAGCRDPRSRGARGGVGGMSLWFGDVTGIALNQMAGSTMIETLGIEVVELRDDALVGRMPVDERTVQPAGVLHGGASVALAVTLASWAGYLT